MYTNKYTVFFAQYPNLPPIQIFPVEDSFTVQKKLSEDEIFSRWQPGQFTVSGADVDLILETFTRLDTAGISIYEYGVLLFTADCNLFGEYNESLKQCTLKYIPVDEYSDLIDNYDKEINLLGLNIPRYGLKVENRFNLELSYSAFPQGATEWYTGTGGGQNVYARERIIVSAAAADELITSELFEILEDNGEWVTLVRDWQLSDYIAPVPGDLVTNNNIYVGTESLGDRAVYYNYIFLEYYGGNALWLDMGAYDTTELTRGRNLKITDAIKYLVNELDAGILFDESGTTTDSFYYLKTYQKDYSVYDQYTLQNLLLSGLSDFMRDPDTVKDEKSDPASVVNITLKRLMDFFKSFWVYWKLEYRSGNYYFVLKHFSEINKATGANPDLTNLYGVDWTAGKNAYSFDTSKYFRRFKREITAQNQDFLGVDITTDITTTTELSTTENKFYRDVWGIMQTWESAYNTNSLDEFVVFSTELQADYIDKLTSFTNVDFATHSFAGGTLTATSAGAATTASNNIAMSKNQGLKISFTLAINSGATPYITFQGITYTCSAGTNVIYTRCADLTTNYIVRVKTDAATNFSMSGFEINYFYYQCVKSVGALSGEQLVNASLSRANMDDEHICKMPVSPVYVNGISKVVATEKTKIYSFVAPVDLQGIEFDNLVNTSYGGMELSDVSARNGYKLANITLKA